MSGSALTASELLAEADRLHQEGRFEEASQYYDQSLARNDQRAFTWYALGCARSSLGERAQAIEALRRAVALDPGDPRFHASYAEALFALGHVSEAVREYALLAGDTDPALRAIGIRNIACVAPGDPLLDNAAILRARRLWADSNHLALPGPAPDWRPGEKLKIGYLGSYFGGAQLDEDVHGRHQRP